MVYDGRLDLVSAPLEVVAEARREAEALMTDTVLLERRSASPVTDPVTGVVSFPTVTIYPTGDDVGRGRVQARSSESANAEVAGASITTVTFQGQMPHWVDVRKDDELTVTASEDALMVGRRFRVEFVPRKTHASKVTATMEEVT